jgi:hypothetical protein
MSEFSGKNVKDLKEAYASIYSETETEEVLSEEEIIESFAREIANEILSHLNEEGLLKEGLDIQEGILDTPIKSVLGGLWGKVVRPVIKQTTGMGTQPKTKAGRVVRAAQTATVPATVVANPGGARDMAVGAVKGAVTGALSGADKAQQEREKKEAEVKKPGGGRAYIDPTTGTIKYQ